MTAYLHYLHYYSRELVQKSESRRFKTTNNEKEKVKGLMKQNISKLKTGPYPDANDYIPYLFNNYTVLDVFGNKEAKIIDC